VKALLGIGVAGLALYALLLAVLYFKQEKLLFMPEKLAAETRFQFSMPHQEVWIDVPGARLHALHLIQAGARGLVFYLHGNGGNVQGWTSGADFYRSIGYDLFMLDYRGYGKSTGSIESEAQLHADARAAWERIAPAYTGRPIIVLGRSLGSGLAAKLAIEVKPALTLLVTPYRSVRALATGVYPFVPGMLVRYPLDTEARIDQIKSPLILMHGDQDELIPVAHAHALKARAPQAELVVIPGARHNDIHEFAQYRATLTQAVKVIQ
jgi:uncharacterized protein